MRIAWYLGFGWLSVATLVATGVGINLTEGWVSWVLYVPFLLAGTYMTLQFRLSNTQVWRRVHRRTMMTYGRLAGEEYDAAKEEGREFDVETPCRRLAEREFGRTADDVELVLGDGRKAYYRSLVAAYPQVFVAGIAPERQPLVLEGVHRDIEASRLGPDVVIAKLIERRHDGLEAARYLHALLLGRVR